MRLGRFLLASVFALAPAAPARPQGDGAAPQAPAAENELFERIVLLGASVTAGFGLDLELEVGADLGVFLDAALRVPHGAVLELGNGMFFANPLDVGAAQASQAREAMPTVVFAVDFLFWYGYGISESEEARAERFERGLAELETFACPLVVADLPDMRPALKGSSPLAGGGPLIAPAQIPAPETLARLNRRLREWAAARDHVSVLPFSEFLDASRAGKEVRVADQTIAAGSESALLQKDLLHPSVQGTAVVTLMALEALRRIRPEIPEDAYSATINVIVAGVYERTAEKRAEHRERAAKREERRRERERREGDDGGMRLSTAPAARVGEDGDGASNQRGRRGSDLFPASAR